MHKGIHYQPQLVQSQQYYPGLSFLDITTYFDQISSKCYYKPSSYMIGYPFPKEQTINKHPPLDLAKSTMALGAITSSSNSTGGREIDRVHLFTQKNFNSPNIAKTPATRKIHLSSIFCFKHGPLFVGGVCGTQPKCQNANVKINNKNCNPKVWE